MIAVHLHLCVSSHLIWVLVLSTSRSPQSENQYREGKRIKNREYKKAASGGTIAPVSRSRRCAGRSGRSSPGTAAGAADLLVSVICELNALAQLREEERPQARLFVGVLDVPWITHARGKVFCSLELSSSSTWWYTFSWQVRIRSNTSLQFLNLSGSA